ncbi:MAG: FAD:protein FMN transferase [Clostridia bacterium]|nr:FAD:protein FMN transferase [Clostridia bacterium]
MKKVLLLFLITCVLTSCSKSPEKFTNYYFDYFDTVTTVTGYADSKDSFDEVCGEIETMLKDYHQLYTIYNRYDGINNLYTVNTTDGAVEVDERIIDLLEYAKEVYAMTGGKTNVAMGSVLSIWHDHRTIGSNHPEKATLPPMERLVKAADHTDIEKIIIDRENSTVELADSEMSIDVGALAKGYATEMVAKWLEDNGYTGYILNVGGNVRTVGAKADGEKWTVGLENPDATGEDDAYIEYLSLAGETVVTSGSYQRYYIVDGKQYHHIIDPETLMPSENFRSVSVICDNSALGDALSTALFCMTYEDGMALVESLDGVEAMWLSNIGEVKYSNGFDKYRQ